jgi:tetratricopeptide (TPR) repeat protein
VGVCLNNLAVVYTHQERYAEAEPVFQRVLRIYEQALGPDHPRYARTLFRYAEWHVAQGLLAEAESLFERAMAIQEKKLPADHPKALATRAAYANLLRATGRQEAAAALE